jgi:hypothetical protein
VTKVQSLGFDARCRADDGTRRFVHATWTLQSGSHFEGQMAVRAHA